MLYISVYTHTHTHTQANRHTQAENPSGKERYKMKRESLQPFPLLTPLYFFPKDNH